MVQNVIDNTYWYNNNHALISKFRGWLWILHKLIKIGHIYSFPPFYFIQNHTLCYLLNWHIFFATSTNVILTLPLPFFFHFFNLNLLTLPHLCINHSHLHVTKSSQAILSHLFINKGHPYLQAILSLYFHLSILTFSLQLDSYYE